MVLGGNRENQIDRTINTIVENQIKLQKDVERLETLENAKARSGLGCITWLDYDIGTKALFTLERTGAYPHCDAGAYCFTQLTVWYYVSSPDNGDLWMQINNHVGANYYHEFTFTRNGATTNGFGATTTAIKIAEVTSDGETLGRVDFPHYYWMSRPHAFGEWSTWHDDEGGQSLQRGQFSGKVNSVINAPFELDFFVTGSPNIQMQTFLYGWCPQYVIGSGPED